MQRMLGVGEERRNVILPKSESLSVSKQAALSEGSSSEPKAAVLSTSDSKTAPPLETAQSFTNDIQADSVSALNPSAGHLSRKRIHKTQTDGQRRKIRPNASPREAQAPSIPTSGGSTVPPLLGIPPGCVPAVESNGQAIGMPFLNQHPFVPTTQSASNPFGLLPPFMYGPMEAQGEIR